MALDAPWVTGWVDGVVAGDDPSADMAAVTDTAGDSDALEAGRLSAPSARVVAGHLKTTADRHTAA